MRQCEINFTNISQMAKTCPKNPEQFQVNAVAFDKENNQDVSLTVFVNTKSQAFDLSKKLYGAEVMVGTVGN